MRATRLSLMKNSLTCSISYLSTVPNLYVAKIQLDQHVTTNMLRTTLVNHLNYEMVVYLWFWAFRTVQWLFVNILIPRNEIEMFGSEIFWIYVNIFYF